MSNVFDDDNWDYEVVYDALPCNAPLTVHEWFEASTELHETRHKTAFEILVFIGAIKKFVEVGFVTRMNGISQTGETCVLYQKTLFHAPRKRSKSPNLNRDENNALT